MNPEPSRSHSFRRLICALFFTCSARSTSKCFRPPPLPSPPSQSLAQRTQFEFSSMCRTAFSCLVTPDFRVSSFEPSFGETWSRPPLAPHGASSDNNNMGARVTASPRAGSAPLSAGKVVTESLRCRKALISDVSH